MGKRVKLQNRIFGLDEKTDIPILSLLGWKDVFESSFLSLFKLYLSGSFGKLTLDSSMKQWQSIWAHAHAIDCSPSSVSVLDDNEIRSNVNMDEDFGGCLCEPFDGVGVTASDVIEVDFDDVVDKVDNIENIDSLISLILFVSMPLDVSSMLNVIDSELKFELEWMNVLKWNCTLKC